MSSSAAPPANNDLLLLLRILLFSSFFFFVVIIDNPPLSAPVTCCWGQESVSCPQSIRFHFVASVGAEVPYLNATIAGSFSSPSFRIYPFVDEARVAGLISTSIRSALDQPLNYAHSYLARLLPACARRVVYLNSDLVLVNDIHDLAGTPLPDSAALAALEYYGANFAAYFMLSFWANPALSKAFTGRRPYYFNTGVMVMDLHHWSRGGYTERNEEWMQLLQRLRIYELGSLPPSCSSSWATSPPSTHDALSCPALWPQRFPLPLPFFFLSLFLFFLSLFLFFFFPLSLLLSFRHQRARPAPSPPSAPAAQREREGDDGYFWKDIFVRVKRSFHEFTVKKLTVR